MILLVDAFFAEAENQVLLRYHHGKSKMKNHEVKVVFTVEQAVELIEKIDFHLVLVNLVLTPEDVGSTAEMSTGAEIILMCLEKSIPVMAILEAVDMATNEEVILLNCVPGVVGEVGLGDIQYQDVSVFHDKMCVDVWIDMLKFCFGFYNESTLNMNQRIRCARREEESLRKAGFYD